MSIALFQATLDTVAAGLALIILNTVLLINSQITLRIWYGALTLITADLT